MNDLPLASRSHWRKAALLALLAALALTLTAVLAAGRPAVAGPLSQTSPVSPLPQPTMQPAASPQPLETATALPETTPAPASGSTALKPPISTAALAGVMLVIGLIALIVAWRRS